MRDKLSLWERKLKFHGKKRGIEKSQLGESEPNEFLGHLNLKDPGGGLYLQKFGSKNVKPDRMEAAWSPGWPKKCKNVPIWLFLLIKPSNQRIHWAKSLYISQGCWFKKIIWNQSQILAWKRSIFWGHPTSGNFVQNAYTLFKIMFHLQNITTLKKSATWQY